MIQRLLDLPDAVRDKYDTSSLRVVAVELGADPEGRLHRGSWTRSATSCSTSTARPR
jgi:hypothetical protein